MGNAKVALRSAHVHVVLPAAVKERWVAAAGSRSLTEFLELAVEDRVVVEAAEAEVARSSGMEAERLGRAGRMLSEGSWAA